MAIISAGTSVISGGGFAISAGGTPEKYVVYDGVNQTITTSSGVSSVTRNGSHDYSVNMSSNNTNAEPLILVTGDYGSASSYRGTAINTVNSWSTSVIRVSSENRVGGAQGDANYYSVAIWDV